MVATQATVSRDLDELGAVKVRVSGGETVYAIPELPKDRVSPEDHLRRVLSDWVVEVAHSANLVVLRTPPGSAHVIGSALDRALQNAVVRLVGDHRQTLLRPHHLGNPGDLADDVIYVKRVEVQLVRQDSREFR